MAAIKYDIEKLIYEIRDLLKDELNDQIQAVFDEKDDGLTYLQLNSAAYAVQSMDDSVANYDIFCFIQVLDIQATGQGPMTAKDLSISTTLIVSGGANQKDATRRMFRYGRALEQTFQDNWDRIGSHRIKFKIQTIPPQDYVDLNGSKSFKTVSVVLSGGLPT